MGGAERSQQMARIVSTAFAVMVLCWTPGEIRAAASTGAEAGAILKQYCVTCHHERLKTAGLVLNQMDPGKVQENLDVWEKVVRKLRTGTMPPPASPAPGSGR